MHHNNNVYFNGQRCIDGNENYDSCALNKFLGKLSSTENLSRTGDFSRIWQNINGISGCERK